MTNVISKVIHNWTEYEFNWVNGWVTSVNGNTWAVTVNDVKVSASAPSSPSEWMAWYDTTNDALKVYDWSNWIQTWAVTSVNWQTWAVTIEEGDSKVFAISDFTSAASLAAAQAAYERGYTNGKAAFIYYNNGLYAYSSGWTWGALFTNVSGYWVVSSGAWEIVWTLKVTISSWNVTAITLNSNAINISSSAPTSWSNNIITLVI